jgi:hypothetical protein
MDLHVRNKGCHAALTQAWSLLFNGWLAQAFSHHCFLLLCRPSVLPPLHKFLLNVVHEIKCTKHPSIAPCSKFPFQQILICPNLTPNRKVKSVILWQCNLSRAVSARASVNVFTITPCTGLQTHWFLMSLKEKLMELLNISFFHLHTSESMRKI